mmetsp:Transcript_17242/g.53449  ORF Transcript_17242/g.53449 Transcript_17242/m.53449 type:complete len:330 (-) Transcript_17242:2029-3018(-)
MGTVQYPYPLGTELSKFDRLIVWFHFVQLDSRSEVRCSRRLATEQFCCVALVGEGERTGPEVHLGLVEGVGRVARAVAAHEEGGFVREPAPPRVLEDDAEMGVALRATVGMLAAKGSLQDVTLQSAPSVHFPRPAGGEAEQRRGAHPQHARANRLLALRHSLSHLLEGAAGGHGSDVVTRRLGLPAGSEVAICVREVVVSGFDVARNADGVDPGGLDGGVSLRVVQEGALHKFDAALGQALPVVNVEGEVHGTLEGHGQALGARHTAVLEMPPVAIAHAPHARQHKASAQLRGESQGVAENDALEVLEADVWGRGVRHVLIVCSERIRA